MDHHLILLMHTHSFAHVQGNLWIIYHFQRIFSHVPLSCIFIEICAGCPGLLYVHLPSTSLFRHTHFSFISLTFLFHSLGIGYCFSNWDIIHIVESSCILSAQFRVFCVFTALWLLPLFNFAYFHHPLTRETPTPCSLCTPVFLLSAWL